jgi:superfamily II DNA or RNA helicase
MENPGDLKKQLNEALNECARLKAENERLRRMLGSIPEEVASTSKSTLAEPNLPFTPSAFKITNNSPAKDKISLFRSLFRGREDVYPVRWERKDGRSGYSPACVLEWKKPLCGKPLVKCGECRHRKFLPVTDEVIHHHLIGKHIVGVYPMLPDETCWFLAVDFDRKTWQEDARAFLDTCRKMAIPAALERSRSGKGGHVWLFFQSPVPASLARKLGCVILTRTLEERHQLGLDSYDRLFPNQDTLPRGGFGNLIALPLQWGPRETGNSVFLDPDGVPYPDQWVFLSGLDRLPVDTVETLVGEASRAGKVISVRQIPTDEHLEVDPWPDFSSGRRKPIPLSGPWPKQIRLVIRDLIYIEKEGLPPSILNALTQLAAFQNPEFYRAQAMRLPIFNIPRIIRCAEDFPQHIGLPRGCLEEVLNFFKVGRAAVTIEDQRNESTPIKVHFRGELRPGQEEAARALLDHETGILSAPTAFGKTVIAAWVIAQRKVSTLVLVHRKQLLDQWRDRLADFLDLAENEIGQIGGGKGKPSGVIDVAVLQSLVRKGVVKDIISDYSQVIVDECHHIPAFSFEQALKKASARFVLGLTATPIRKDGHQPILMMQCGPLRYKGPAKKGVQDDPFEHLVLPRWTEFNLPPNKDLTIQEIYNAMLFDQARNDLIFDDLLTALEAGRSPLLLTERTEHLELLAGRLKNFSKNMIILKGGMGKKQRTAINDQMKAIPDREERLILATGRYIGEGFDDARLDTLFLVMPISWRGTLQQYVGRLHRLHDSKRLVQVYDYVDKKVPMLMRMYNKRLIGYKALGYKIEKPRTLHPK